MEDDFNDILKAIMDTIDESDKNLNKEQPRGIGIDKDIKANDIKEQGSNQNIVNINDGFVKVQYNKSFQNQFKPQQKNNDHNSSNNKSNIYNSRTNTVEFKRANDHYKTHDNTRKASDINSDKTQCSTQDNSCKKGASSIDILLKNWINSHKNELLEIVSHKIIQTIDMKHILDPLVAKIIQNFDPQQLRDLIEKSMHNSIDSAVKKIIRERLDF